MGLIRRDIFIWCTTPEDLRRVANRLEQQWNEARLGDVVPTYTLIQDQCELRIIVNQEEMELPK